MHLPVNMDFLKEIIHQIISHGICGHQMVYKLEAYDLGRHPSPLV